jgi:Protein of unknown function (DUF3297)
MSTNLVNSNDSTSLNPVAMPDRLSVDAQSKFYNQAILEKGVGIRFNGKQRFDVEEYCISEGWIAIEHTRAKDRHGKPLLVKLKGQVEVFIDPAPAA